MKLANLYRGPSIDAYYQVSVQLAKQFQGGFVEIFCVLQGCFYYWIMSIKMNVPK
jgi:hypothetical protein